MTEPYFTEDQKLVRLVPTRWSSKECHEMHEILRKKGYLVNTVSRRGCDCKYHDAWQVERADVPQLIEELFRQRLIVEVQAEGKYKASINFCYDYSATTVLNAAEYFRKNKRNGGKL